MISWLSWYRYCDCLALCLFVWGCDRWTGIIVSLSYIYRYFALDDNHVKCYYSQILSSIIHSILDSRFSILNSRIPSQIPYRQSSLEPRILIPLPLKPRNLRQENQDFLIPPKSPHHHLNLDIVILARLTREANFDKKIKLLSMRYWHTLVLDINNYTWLLILRVHFILDSNLGPT